VIAFALMACAWTVLEIVTGGNAGLLYVAPALVVCAPMLLGRYPGEVQLARLAQRSCPRRTRRVAASVPSRTHVRVMQRGGRLVGCALAKRPPPRCVPLPTP
jgi:hypothetical protein